MKKRAVMSSLPILANARRRKLPPIRIIPEIFGVGKGPSSAFFLFEKIAFERRFVRAVACGTAFFAYNGGKRAVRTAESRKERRWRREETAGRRRCDASSRPRSSWFIRVRVGFATSGSFRRGRTADSAAVRARFAFRCRRWFARIVVGRRAFRRGRFAVVAGGSRFGKRRGATTRCVGVVFVGRGIPNLRSTKRVRCIFIGGRPGLSCCD